MKKIIKIGEKYKGRVNEFGNYIEDKILELFKHSDVKVNSPKNNKGNKTKAGYPDFQIELKDILIYCDCKVYKKEGSNKNTFRSFYFKPSEPDKLKVKMNAPHCLLMFSHEEIKKGIFTILDYKLVNLYDLQVGFKAEFNTSNKVTTKLKDIF